MFTPERLAFDAALVAEGSRLKGLSSGFRQEGDPVDMRAVLVGLLIAAGFVVALWLLARLVERQSGGRRSNSPLGLFLSLCRAHKLRWPDRWLLWRVARHHRLADPARVFLEPERLATAGLGPRLRRYAGRLEGLRARLFAGLEEAGPEAGSHEPASAVALPVLDLPADFPSVGVPPG
jgi:hypothetical protein